MTDMQATVSILILQDGQIDSNNLTLSPLTRDYPETQNEEASGPDTVTTETLEASKHVRNTLDKLRTLAPPFHLLRTSSKPTYQ